MAIADFISHPTGFRQVVTVPLNSSTAGATAASVSFPYQCNVESARWSAGTAPVGTDAQLILGTAASTSNIISAASVNGSTNASLTVIANVVVAKNTAILAQFPALATTTSSIGGCVTLVVNFDTLDRMS